jgi:thiol peroxidase
MAEITLKGNPIHTVGELPAVGSEAPDFVLTGKDLSDVKLSELRGQKVVLNIFVSLDTDICANSVRRFNNEAQARDNTKVVCASLDLPFAHGRFCTTEGLDNVISATELRDRNFGNSYGVRIADGPLAGLLSRAIVVIDENGIVAHTEQVPEIAQEPNYEAALKALD